MEPKYMYAESTIKPQSIEMCKNTVYLRTDFVETSRTDMSNKVTYWTYQEARLTTDEFNSYVSWLMSKNAINGINDSGNISQLVIGQKNRDNDQMIIMEAITDLYDAIASMTQEVRLWQRSIVN